MYAKDFHRWAKGALHRDSLSPASSDASAPAGEQRAAAKCAESHPATSGFSTAAGRLGPVTVSNQQKPKRLVEIRMSQARACPSPQDAPPPLLAVPFAALCPLRLNKSARQKGPRGASSATNGLGLFWYTACFQGCERDLGDDFNEFHSELPSGMQSIDSARARDRADLRPALHSGDRERMQRYASRSGHGRREYRPKARD